MTTQYKICTKCLGKPQPISNFYPRADRPGKTFSRCKSCILSEQKVSFQRNPEKRKAIVNKSNLKYNLNNLEGYIFRRAKTRAKKNNIPFNIEVSDVLIPKYCPVLGLELKSTLGTGKGHYGPNDNSPSIDRINPDLGYVKGNVRIISHRANTIKNDATIDELKKVIAYIEQSLQSAAPGAEPCRGQVHQTWR